ncbi:MAG: hypothetical protein A2021_08580 [Elusimicrobia bacterium GWF2_52_66]|nr:MAG: hypothetical protein A2X33_11255 [Elusimicrobia bacterium GWA2_51_34]OGR85023.1 MAG: hypothetical protein A2021_08580 [Elusimicrobia bacterium GWF2_52_66]HAF96624.1 hypothetical protein [Elusimicrobiota bacterium]HCE98586.1 hypothetical protein [Elusimicrobiota bacterium]
MTVRCELNINGGTRRILLVAKEEETIEHVALRLAAAILFFDQEPALEAGPRHPAVVDFGFFPDLLAADEAGAVGIWIECGNVATNKLAKVARRLRGARMVVLKESPEDGRRFREVIKKEIPKGEKIEIWAWPKGEFIKWANALRESSHVYGEASGRSLNLVLNEVPFCVDLISC